MDMTDCVDGAPAIASVGNNNVSIVNDKNVCMNFMIVVIGLFLVVSG